MRGGAFLRRAFWRWGNPSGARFSSSLSSQGIRWGREFSRCGCLFCRDNPFLIRPPKNGKRALHCGARFFVGAGNSVEIWNPNRSVQMVLFAGTHFPHYPVMPDAWESLPGAAGDGRRTGHPISCPSIIDGVMRLICPASAR